MDVLQAVLGAILQVEQVVLRTHEATWGVLAGVIQALAYALYFYRCIRRERDPNPFSWIMFFVDTGLFTFLEWDVSAPWYLLTLPAVCSTSSLVIAILIWKRGAMRKPDHFADWFAVIAFFSLLTLYLLVTYTKGIETYVGEERAIEWLIWLANLITAISFIPIVRNTYNDPHSEYSPPWVVWTLAYLCLGVSTYQAEGMWTILMVYPASCAVLHGIMAWCARPSLKRE